MLVGKRSQIVMRVSHGCGCSSKPSLLTTPEIFPLLVFARVVLRGVVQAVSCKASVNSVAATRRRVDLAKSILKLNISITDYVEIASGEFLSLQKARDSPTAA